MIANEIDYISMVLILINTNTYYLVFKASIIGYKDIKVTSGDDIKLTCKVDQVPNIITK